MPASFLLILLGLAIVTTLPRWQAGAGPGPLRPARIAIRGSDRTRTPDRAGADASRARLPVRRLR